MIIWFDIDFPNKNEDGENDAYDGGKNVDDEPAKGGYFVFVGSLGNPEKVLLHFHSRYLYKRKSRLNV